MGGELSTKVLLYLDFCLPELDKTPHDQQVSRPLQMLLCITLNSDGEKEGAVSVVPLVDYLMSVLLAKQRTLIGNIFFAKSFYCFHPPQSYLYCSPYIDETQ